MLYFRHLILSIINISIIFSLVYAKEKPVIVFSGADTANLIEPHTFRSTSAYMVTHHVFEPLIRQKMINDNGLLIGSREIHLGTGSESYSINETSDGGFLGVFKIRKNQTFADGRQVTAKDYKYMFDRSIKGPGYIGLLLPFIGISDVNQISLTDEMTLQIKTNVKSPLFERFMTFQVFGALNMVEAKNNSNNEDPWAFEYYKNKSGGSGPYYVGKFSPDSEVVLKPNPGYWNADKIPNGGLILKAIPDSNERARLVSSGFIDVAGGIPPRLLSKLKNDSNVKVYNRPSSGVVYLAMNQTIKVMKNINLRRAIVHAVPYSELINNVMYGYASPAGGVVTSSMETYDNNIGNQFSKDLNKARKYLKDSGINDPKLLLGVRESRLEDQEAAVLIQDSLRKVGISIEIQILPDGDFGNRINKNELPLFIHDWYSWGEDPFYQMMFLSTCGQWVNYARFCNKEYDKLVKEGAFTLDNTKRNSLSSKAQRIFYSEAVWAPLWSADRTIVTNKCVNGLSIGYSSIADMKMMSKKSNCN